MTRITVTPGRDTSKPLVEDAPDGSPAERVGNWLLRGYLAVGIAIAVGTVLISILFVLLWDSS